MNSQQTVEWALIRLQNRDFDVLRLEGESVTLYAHHDGSALRIYDTDGNTQTGSDAEEFMRTVFRDDGISTTAWTDLSCVPIFPDQISPDHFAIK